MSEDGSPTPFSLTLNATDADVADTLTWSISTPAAKGTADASGTGLSKAITYTPNADYNGSDSFVVQVSDGTLTDTITVSVTINPEKDAPVITESDPASVSMSEDGSPTPFSLTLNATDADVADTLTWSISTPAAKGTAGASGTGTSKAITYTPTANYNGSDSFVVQVSDGTLTDTITVNVNIAPQDDPLVIATPISDVTVDENSPDTVIDLSTVFSDVDNDNSAITKTIASNSNPSLVTAAITGNTLTLDYQENQIGTSVVGVLGTSGGKTVTDEFIVTVNPRYYQIDGLVTYSDKGIPVSNVTVTLTGTLYGDNTAITGSTGDYTFNNIRRDGYESVPSKPSEPEDIAFLSATDASLIARYAVGLLDFNEFQKMAADSTINGEITGLDASRLARYKVGLISYLNDRNISWVFSPGSRVYNPLESDQNGQNFSAILLGDVSGNYTGGPLRDTQAMEKSVKVDLTGGSTLAFPIVLEQDHEIQGIDIVIEFDEEIMDAADVTLTGTLLEDHGYDMVFNKNEGRVSIAIYAVNTLFKGRGTVGYVHFNVTERKGETTVIFKEFKVNEQSVFAGQYPEDPCDVRYDLTEDGRVDARDAIDAARNGMLAEMIQALRCICGGR
jgi:VCBS repeat-containing protein